MKTLKNIVKPSKIIAQVDITTGEIINKFKIYTDAYVSLKIPKSNRSNINNCCKGYRDTAYGFKWKFIDE